MPATMVRNHQPGPAVFADDSTGHKPVVWQGAGDMNNQDVRAVPEALLESVYFQDALEKGIFSIVESKQESTRIREAHRASWQAAEERRATAGQEALDASPDEDLVMLSCLGPAGRGTNKLCGQELTVKSAQRDKVPPLCNKHQYLKSQFIPTDTGRIVNGKSEVSWSRASVTPASKGDHN